MTLEGGNKDFETMNHGGGDPDINLTRRQFGGLLLGLGGCLGVIGVAGLRTLGVDDFSLLGIETGSDERAIPKEEAKESEEQVLEREIRETMITYLGDPRFSNEDFLEQSTGYPGRFEMHITDAGWLVFSIEKDKYKEEDLGMLLENTNAKIMGQEEDGKVKILGMQSKDTSRIYFAIKPKDLKLPDFNTKIQRKSKDKVAYEVSLLELNHALRNRNVFGGNLDYPFGMDEQKAIGRRRIKAVSNHGAFVAKPGAESLNSVVKKCKAWVDRDLKKRGSKEWLAFALRVFNHGLLEYNGEGLGEKLERYTEVYMHGKTDCSGFAIGLASLYEQAGFDYLLVYVKGHITVAVAGDFPMTNGLNFEFDGKRYFVSEPTAGKFYIGSSKVQKAPGVPAYPENFASAIKAVQRPGEHLVDYKTRKPLSPV